MGSHDPELKLFVDTTRQLLAEPGVDVRQLYAAGVGLDRAWWKRAADIGWTALAAPEAFGGGSISGEAVTDLTVLAEEFGRHAAPGPLLPVSTVLAGLAESGDTDRHGATIEAIVTGENVVTWAHSGDGYPVRCAPAVTARPVDAGYRLTGTVARVEAAPQADAFLVPATTPDRVIQVLVPSSTAGVTVRQARSIDLVRQYGTVRFDDVEVPDAALVGAPETTANAIERQFQIAVLLRCAETVGVMNKAFEMTRQWAFDRYSFGRPLASYQALKHRYATMSLWLQACAATAGVATQAVQNRDPDANKLLSVAKAYIGEKSVPMLQDCIQLHGGIGVTWEHDLHLYLRRAALNANTFGTPDDHYSWLAGHQGVPA
jgi:alkylation response protein AidB-like acyl-CoA dehydrogenase